MSLEFKRRFNENLDLIPVYIEDTSLTSEAYFGIKEFPSFFGRGKNGVRIKPNEDILKPNSQLYIEILDVNLNSVYYEIPDYEPGDLSRYISVWVYGERDDIYNTPNGIGEMIICGIAERTEDGEIIPEEFRDVINVRWKRKISISRDSRSESPIVFTNQNSVPIISVSESFSFYREIPTQSLNQPQIVNQTVNQNIIYTSDFGGQNVFLETPNYQLNPNSIGGKIKINLQNTTLSPQITSAELSAGMLKPQNYTASLQSFITSRKVRVSNPLTASVSTKTASLLKTFTLFSTGSFVVETISTGSTTIFSQSLAHITIKDVNPILGNVDKINVYIRSRATGGTLTEYQLIGTKLLYDIITGSSTDIYSDTQTNVTQSTHTFLYNPTNKNVANDIKIEYLNSQNDFANYESILTNYYFKGYDSQASGSGGGGDITELSQSLSTQINNVSSSLSTITNVIKDTGDNRLGLNIQGEWNNTTEPSNTLLSEGEKIDWLSGENISLIRNSSPGTISLLADPDGYLKIKLHSNEGVDTDYIIFLPYYSSSYSG